MSPGGQERHPNPAWREVYDRDFRKFLSLYKHRAELEAL